MKGNCSLVRIFLTFSLVLQVSCQEGNIDIPLGPQTLEEKTRALMLQSAEKYGSFLLPDSDDYENIPQDPKNPITKEKVALGKLLFHETAMAKGPENDVNMNTYSCSTCHFASAGFQSGRAQGVGEGASGFSLHEEGRIYDHTLPKEEVDAQLIRTPAVLNVTFQKNMLWNGQLGATGLNTGTESKWEGPAGRNWLGYEGVETQSIAGLDLHRLKAKRDDFESLGYLPLFDKAFPEIDQDNIEGYNLEQAGLAIAAYERTILSNEAPFQKWLKGDTKALSDSEKRGFKVFIEKKCVSCHNGPALNSEGFYAWGLKDLKLEFDTRDEEDIEDTTHLGRGGFTDNPLDNYKYKVPQLYNLKDFRFFGHGSSFTDLRSFLNYKLNATKENNDVPDDQLASFFRTKKNLSEQEFEDLLDFLTNGLYDPSLERYQPEEVLSGQCFPNNDAKSRAQLGCD